MEITRLEHRESFITADGSSIRELAGIPSGNAVNQSLARPPSARRRDLRALPPVSEEIYYFTAGSGRMRLGDEEADVKAGDMVVIAPGVKHKLWNPGAEPLVLLCCCSPRTRTRDTVLLEGGA